MPLDPGSIPAAPLLKAQVRISDLGLSTSKELTLGCPVCPSFVNAPLPHSPRSAGVAVRVAGRVTALQAGLVDPQTAEVVPVRKEACVGDHAARRDVGVQLDHPRA